MSMDFSEILKDGGTEDKIRVRSVCGTDGIVVWSVRGEVVRDDLDVDFAIGGHGYNHDYIPEDEVWIERSMSRRDFALAAAHEAAELLLMRRGVGHDEAHEMAAGIERRLRTRDGEITCMDR